MDGWVFNGSLRDITGGVRITATFSGPDQPNRVVVVDGFPLVAMPEEGEQFVQFAIEVG